MDIAVCFFRLISLLCELFKSMTEAVVSQLHRIEQLLVNLNESTVSNNINAQLKLNLLEKLVSNSNDTQLRIISLENKMQELQDLVSKSFKKSNQKLSQKELEQIKEIKEEVVSLDKKIIPNDSVELLNGIPSTSQLLDKFLFGSQEEQMTFESICLKWTINHIDSLIPEQRNGEEDYECTSDIFPVYGYPLDVQLRLTIDSDGNINLELCFKDEEREGQEVDIKPLPMVNFLLKDCNRNNRNIVRYDYLPFHKSLEYNEFGYWSVSIEKSLWNTLISPNDKSMEVLVLVEPSPFTHKLFWTNGSISDSIRHYSRRLQMAREGLIDGHWSAPFLTHADGYRVGVWMDLNRTFANNKRGLVAWICFLSGEFDSKLGKEFIHETSVTLINQLDANENITVKQQARNINKYYMEIACDNKINSGGFLLNDSLIYHVTIKAV